MIYPMFKSKNSILLNTMNDPSTPTCRGKYLVFDKAAEKGERSGYNIIYKTKSYVYIFIIYIDGLCFQQ